MPTLDDDIFRRFTERISELNENLGRRVENARESVDEEKDLNEAERFLRQKEKKEREQAAEEIKKARQAEADAIWNSLSNEEKRQIRANELDAAALKLKNKENQDKQAYIDELKKINDDQESTFRRRANYELESLGLVKDSQGKLHQLANEREAIEKKLIEDLQKGLAESPDLQKKYGTDAKNAKLAMDQEKLYKQQLASMGRYVNSNNEIIDTTIKLNKEQEASLRKIKAENEARDKAEKSLEEFKDMFGKKGAIAAGSFVLTAAFDFLKAGVVGTYKGLIAYEDALLDGVRGQSVMAAMISEQQNALADSIEKTGGGMVDFGVTMMAVGVQVTLAAGPIGLLAVAIGGLLAILGYASQAQAEIIRYDAKRNKDRAALEDQAFKDFLQLGEASVTGAKGVTGMIDDLKRVGLTIKEFDKLNKILSSNTKEIAMFGSTTVDGSKKFIEVTGGLIHSEMSKTFEKMGISQNSQMEHAQKYMAMQARFGLLEGKSKQDLIKGTQNYINELDKTAALTGASRKEQETARDFAMAQAELRAAIFDAKEKAKGGDAEAAIRVKELQGQFELVSKLKLIGQDQLGIGVARNAAAGGIVDQSSANAVRMLAGSIEAYKTGAGSEQSRVGGLGGELKAGFKELAPLASISADAIKGLADVAIPQLIDGIETFNNVEKLRKEFLADPKNKGKTFDEKALDEMLSRVAKDSRTQADVDAFRRTQEEAIAKQTGLLNGQLSAGQKMLEASGMFGKAGKTMLDAGKYMYNAAFGGDKGDAENLAKDIMVKDEAISTASERVEIAKKKLEKKGINEKDKKEAEEELKVWSDQVAMLKKQREQMVQEKKIHEDIAAIQGQRNAKQDDIAKATALRKETLMLKHNQELKEEMAKYDAEVAAGKRTNDINARRGRELTLNRKFQDELKQFENETNAQYRTVASSDEIKGKIAKLQAQLKEVKEKGPVAYAPVSESAATTSTAASNSRKAHVNKKSEAKDTAEDAPEMAEGGVVPGSAKGTTVTVGEKGSPEAIMPLNALSDMLGSTRDKGDNDQRYAQIIKLNSNFSGLIDISSKSVELEKIGNELSKDNNKLLETEIKTSDKLIISMNKVTDMLPNVLSQIIAATYNNTSGGGTTAASGGPTAATASGAPTAASGGTTAPTSTDMLRQAGLILKKGDVQADGKEVDPRIIEIAKQVQASIPGFMQFTGFNDQFHNENTPGSKHTKGKAFDFVLSKAPSKEEAAKILAQMKSLGIDYAQDEYNNPSSEATGGHFHGQLNAFDGGVFEPRPGGVHVNLAEAGLREAAVPLNPGEKIRVEKPESDNNPPRKDPLSTVLANDNQSSSNSNQSAEILAALHDLMEDKFDSMISALRDGNDISDKLLKYSQV